MDEESNSRLPLIVGVITFLTILFVAFFIIRGFWKRLQPKTNQVKNSISPTIYQQFVSPSITSYPKNPGQKIIYPTYYQSQENQYYQSNSQSQSGSNNMHQSQSQTLPNGITQSQSQ